MYFTQKFQLVANMSSVTSLQLTTVNKKVCCCSILQTSTRSSATRGTARHATLVNSAMIHEEWKLERFHTANVTVKVI